MNSQLQTSYENYGGRTKDLPWTDILAIVFKLPGATKKLIVDELKQEGFGKNVKDREAIANASYDIFLKTPNKTVDHMRDGGYWE